MKYWGVSYDEAIEHYGVKGMKWRRHNKRKQDDIKKHKNTYDGVLGHLYAYGPLGVRRHYFEKKLHDLEDRIMDIGVNYINKYIKRGARSLYYQVENNPKDFVWVSDQKSSVDRTGDKVIETSNAIRKTTGQRSNSVSVYAPSVTKSDVKKAVSTAVEYGKKEARKRLRLK